MDPGTRRALQEMGCSLAQGYLFSHPIPPESFGGYLDRVGPVPPTSRKELRRDAQMVLTSAHEAHLSVPRLADELGDLTLLLAPRTADDRRT